MLRKVVGWWPHGELVINSLAADGKLGICYQTPETDGCIHISLLLMRHYRFRADWDLMAGQVTPIVHLQSFSNGCLHDDSRSENTLLSVKVVCSYRCSSKSFATSSAWVQDSCGSRANALEQG